MNYIKQLEADNAQFSKAVSDTDKAMTDLLAYLGSDKFWSDTTVQVSDVAGRLARIRADMWHGQP